MLQVDKNCCQLFKFQKMLSLTMSQVNHIFTKYHIFFTIYHIKCHRWTNFFTVDHILSMDFYMLHLQASHVKIHRQYILYKEDSNEKLKLQDQTRVFTFLFLKLLSGVCTF